ncbi:L-rhamnono-gamma-lactonase [Yamadazyma tenuis]|uniref:Amidohydrolase-related domain-containing protein n=1 Tax=Candida tenuis (strain ATCC 10573 / BCRC 21748 / CBS 615 / JCM 9827 / NBRC 10315 / NRRL Y-1498 / VKM Y-70) TaxID=590646 RepID=G3B6K5_CANTC|nr:uncharacterized protein CANTEDRAFT_130934 [Yamadazyma tenuis ATCC 10573]EGV63491.1 hypothetical protein CANTEDRAFT_130934 [Yamadazyma tenuis ATCC 10573]WEJ96685.1 L-rhamnono-gamma-lactonase [Yamadazyma tenuis]
MKLIDSHIHLSALANQQNMKWQADHPLHKQNRLDEYVAQLHDVDVQIDGVVAIEFDPKNKDPTTLEGCQQSVEEYLYFGRVARGELRPEEGSNQHAHLLKAVIPWAPMPSGPELLEQYVDSLRDSSFHLVKGFRYLLQDKPKQVMLQPQFIKSLKWLEKNNFVFDWGIDLRCGGTWQFEETIDLFKQVSNVKYIINHMTKPTYKDEDIEVWGKYMAEIYRLSPNSYMKLSGGFSELPVEINDDLEKCADLIFPWFNVCWDLWGVDRTIWASNWPVCELKKKNVVANWAKVTEILFDKIHLPQEDRYKVYNTNYKAAYNV